MGNTALGDGKLFILTNSVTDVLFKRAIE